MKKTRIYLDEAEWRFLLDAMNKLRNSLIAEGRYTRARAFTFKYTMIYCMLMIICRFEHQRRCKILSNAI
jgi:hypothetical protein